LPPAPPRPAGEQEPDPVAAVPAGPAPAPAGADDGPPPPPPAARRYPREQLNTKIRVDLRQRMNAFVERHESTLQGVLEAALDEYMARRGWSWEDYHRAARRR
jgi:hypothetical protein